MEDRTGLWQGIPETLTVEYTPIRFIRLIIHEMVADENVCDEPGIARVEVYCERRAVVRIEDYIQSSRFEVLRCVVI